MAVLCRLMVMHVKDALDVACMPWSDVGSLTGATGCKCYVMLEFSGMSCYKCSGLTSVDDLLRL